jgi:ribosomal protein S18 acetylase RimI-like enzyme
VAALHRVAAGEVLGPLLDVSTVASLEGAVVGACLVVEREGAPPDGGPWVLDIFRNPACTVRGIGAALLVASLQLARRQQLPGLSLAVSHANATARRLYARLGFVEVSAGRTLLVPSP